MNRLDMRKSGPFRRPPSAGGLLLAALVLGFMGVAPAHAAGPTGKVQGHLVATDTGDPLGFADVVLFPADTTRHPIGTMANGDGTFLIEAPAGTYDIQFRAISYAPKRIRGIVIVAGRILPINTALQPEAIQQKEIVVEARARANTDRSLLEARKRASTVGDAVSAEQVRRTPDANAAEVLRRVTGLNVSGGKYVFVRGLGERYSSTEIDGVRIASPEQNKRVVPLDLLPSSLLDHVVVQKTYSADRSGEFGGGDVQVHTKDFPGARLWSFSVSQGWSEGVTFKNRTSYHGSGMDVWGFGSGDRGIPQAVLDATSGTPLVAGSPPYGLPRKTLAALATSFANIWSPTQQHTAPNGSYSLTYGDEFKVFGRPLGIIASSNFSRSFAHRTEAQRFFASPPDTFYAYAVDRSTASAQLGAISAVSYRFSPAHEVHVRGIYSNSADDEVRTYQGEDHNRTESLTGQWIQHRDTRLMYVQRDVASGAIEGRDEFRNLLGTTLDWKFSRSIARRQQPDRREVSYDNGYYVGPDGGLVEYWALGSTGSREFGDLHDNGWGTTVKGTLPFRLQVLGKGKLLLGYDRQSKRRSNFYRRFSMFPNRNADPTAPPESLFSENAFDGSASTGYLQETTLPQDNYHAHSLVEAGYLSLKTQPHRRLRGELGVRVEHGSQNVASYDLFHPDQIAAQGSFANTDWLPSANLTWSPHDVVSVRLAASRTLSRPDLNELSPSPSLEYVGGYRQAGNPNLHRTLIGNFDARVEVYPGGADLLAAGWFAKKLDSPIVQEIAGSVPPLIMPVNADHGTLSGVELEARSDLGRWWHRLRGLMVNANASFISSRVVLKTPGTQLSSLDHPLQGQANYVVNAALTYQSRGRALESTVLVGAVGKRLYTLGYLLPDIYDQPTTSLDAKIAWTPAKAWRVTLGAKNLLNTKERQMQGTKEVSSYRNGRSASIALSFGS